MATVLREYQHELTTDYDDGAEPLVSLVFGTEDTSYLTTGYPTIDGDEGVVGDVQRYRGEGVSFGEDFDGPKKATFEIGVLTDKAADPEGAVHDALGLFESVWRDERLRDRATKYAVLRSNMSGRVRRAYGRPRRFSDTPGVTTRRGYNPLVCDFQVQDGRWYDDVVSSVSTTIGRTGIDGTLAASTLAGGRWVFATVPGPGRPDGYLPTVGAAVLRPEGFRVAGARPTWPVVKFHAGPASSVLNPSATIGGLTIGLADVVPAGQTVTVDTRPWSRQVVRSDGANRSGKLTPDTPPLRRCVVKPGAYSLIYDGTDPTGGSWCEVQWRNAYSRW